MMDKRKLTDEEIMREVTGCVKKLLAMPSDRYEECRLVLNAVTNEINSEGAAAFVKFAYMVADELRPLAIEMKA